MLALEPIDCTRIVGRGAAVSTKISGRAVGVVLAPDELVVVPVDQTTFAVDAPDHCVVESDQGFSGRWMTPSEFGSVVAFHIEWPIPVDRPASAQGLVAGVPSKLFFGADERVLLLCATAYAHELMERLG